MPSQPSQPPPTAAADGGAGLRVCAPHEPFVAASAGAAKAKMKARLTNSLRPSPRERLLSMTASLRVVCV
jgi:hypothetical protein